MGFFEDICTPTLSLWIIVFLHFRKEAKPGERIQHTELEHSLSPLQSQGACPSGESPFCMSMLALRIADTGVQSPAGLLEPHLYWQVLP